MDSIECLTILTIIIFFIYITIYSKLQRIKQENTSRSEWTPCMNRSWYTHDAMSHVTTNQQDRIREYHCCFPGICIRTCLSSNSFPPLFTEINVSPIFYVFTIQFFSLKFIISYMLVLYILVFWFDTIYCCQIGMLCSVYMLDEGVELCYSLCSVKDV
jgi:hypothetical protein